MTDGHPAAGRDMSSAPGRGRRAHHVAVTRRPSGEPPPLPRQLGQGTIAWWIGSVAWAVVWVVALVWRPVGAWVADRDLDLLAPIVRHRVRPMDEVMGTVNTVTVHWLVPVTGWSVIVVGLATRRIRHVVLLAASLGVTAAIATVAGVLIARPRPLGVDVIGEWHGYAQPSRPLALAAAALTSGLLTVVPRRPWRRRAIAVVVVVLTVAASGQLYTAVEHPSDVLAGITLGVAVALAAYRIAAPESVFPIGRRTGRTAHLDVSGARGRAIVAALREQLGVEVVSVAPVGLAGSAGSTPLRLTLADGASLFAKLYASSHLRADRFYKLGRTLRYGRLEDEHRFATVRRLVQHEDHMLRLFDAAGIDVPEPHGIVELTPEREYLVVTDFLADAHELDGIVVDTSTVDQGIEIVERMWRAGLAHRDIKPSNLMLRDGRLFVVDVAFATVRPSPWRQAVDLANMLLVLGLAAGAGTVYARARRRFTDDEVAEAMAACRGVTIPGQLRVRLRAHDDDLVAAFRALVPAHPPVPVQRWSLRRVGLTIWTVAATALATFAMVDNLGEIGLLP